MTVDACRPKVDVAPVGFDCKSQKVTCLFQYIRKSWEVYKGSYRTYGKSGEPGN